MGWDDAAIVLVCLVVVVLSLALIGVYQRMRSIEEALLDGAGQTLSAGLRREPEDLLHTPPGTTLNVALRLAPGCVNCNESLTRFVDARSRDYSSTVRWIILIPEGTELSQTLRSPAGLEVIEDNKVYQRLAVRWNPAVVLIDASGTRRAVLGDVSVRTLLQAIKRELPFAESTMADTQPVGVVDPEGISDDRMG